MKLWSREPIHLVLGDGSVGPHIPFEVRDLLRHAYPTGDYGDTSAHHTLIESARMGDRTYEVAGELQHVGGIVPLIGYPVEGETCDFIHVARYLTAPPPMPLSVGPQGSTRSGAARDLPPHVKLEYVGLGFLLISILGPFASYRRVSGSSPHPASVDEIEDAEGKVRAALEHAGVELLPWSVLNARVDGMKPAQIEKRLYVPTVYVCLFRRRV